MLISITAGMDFSAYALASSGKCGANATYTFNSSGGFLTISGEGALPDWNGSYFSDSNNLRNNPFFHATEINQVIINNGITRIGINAFYLCANLYSIRIPTSVTSIGANAFYHCSLLSITIPNSVTSIGAHAFEHCSYLKSIMLPNSVTSIDAGTFRYCSGLTSITIPNSVTSIGANAFEGCTSLSLIDYLGSSENWSKVVGNNAIPNTVTIHTNDNHIYDNGVITTQPTCGYAGVKTYTCTVCGVARTESIPATGVHSYNSGIFTVQPTCTTTGIKTFTCTVCGDKITEPVAALGHNYQFSVEAPATCEEDGCGKYTCSRCGDSYYGNIKALGHDYITTIKKATPSNSGYVDTVCSRCGDEHYKYIDSVDAVLSKYTYNYDGKAKKPTVTVFTDTDGTRISKDHYTVKYPAGRKKMGTYTVTVTLKGKYYSGTIKQKFKIQPKPINGNTIKSKPVSNEEIYVSWNKVKGVDGYNVYRWNSKKNDYVLYKKTTKTNIKIKRENKKTNEVYFSIRTYKKQGKKTFTSSDAYDYNWVKLTAPTFNIEQDDFKKYTIVFPYKDYYYIQISNNKNFSTDDKDKSKNYWVNTVHYNEPIKRHSRVATTNRKLYIRVRKFYYNKNGKLVLGPWSKVKTVVPY